jgi:DnaD/phage-associated family protein
MSKTILANTDGFTPVIDALAKELGLMPAVVFGRMWRFCQMEDGVCKATLETIAEGIGIDRATVQRHAKVLCDSGYLTDLTPDLRNRPHVYADTGKAGLKVSISGIAQSNVDKSHVAQRNVTIAQRNADVADSNAHVAQSYMNKVLKKDSKTEEKKEEGAGSNIFTAYQNNIGMVTPMIADSLKDLETEYPPEWIVEAIQIAVENNARRLKYISAILDRWKREGKDEGKKPGKNGKQPAALNPEKYVTGEYSEFIEH